MTIGREAWRRQVWEEAIEPDLPIVDAHHHIWPRAPVAGYEPWDVAQVRAYKAWSGHRILATVYSESHANYRTSGPAHLRVVGEADYVDALGEAADREGGAMAGLCRAMVGNADMMRGAAVGEVLDAFRAAAPGRFRGIRHITASDPDMGMPAGFGAPPGIMASAPFFAAFAQLAARQLVFDAFVPHTQLGEVAALARRFPETAIVVNHGGGPLGIGRHARGGFDAWRDGLAGCAAQANVTLKLGGLHMWYTGLVAADAPRPLTSDEMAEAHGPHILAAIGIFGAGRCMFESNFPVDLVNTGPTLLWNGFKKMTAGLDAGVRADLFAGTATRVYRLERL